MCALKLIENVLPGAKIARTELEEIGPCLTKSDVVGPAETGSLAACKRTGAMVVSSARGGGGFLVVH